MNHTPPKQSGFGSSAALALACILSFAVSGPAHAASGPLGPSILGAKWSTYPAVPCDGDDVRLLFSVCECQVDLVTAYPESLGPIVVHLRIQPDIRCITCHPDTHVVDVGTLLPGTHAFTVRVDIEYVTPPGPEWPTSPLYERVEFPVARECGLPLGVPFLEQVVIGEGAGCPTCPNRVCPHDSVDVVLRGTFPDDCIGLVGVTLVPNPSASPLPLPPIVRLTYGINSCLGRPCALTPYPWRALVRLPEQPYLGGQVLPLSVEAYQRDLCLPDDPVGRFLGRDNFPFFVAENCSTPPPGEACANVRWFGPGPRLCLDTYSWTKSAQVVLGVGSTAPISGVQGTLTLDVPNVVIQTIEAARPGWQLVWSRLSDRHVSFILFAGTEGKPIPGDLGGRPDSLLRVWVASGPTDIPEHATLTLGNVLVSDPAGNEIRPCPVLLADAIYPPPNVALLCRASRCDANADARSDVRDLVVMLNCLYPPPNVRLDCPDPFARGLDCDSDGTFDLDDVFCCALAILNGGPGVPPPDTTLREAPEIAVRFGLPRTGHDGLLEVPLLFEGMADVAAARLHVTYPDDRYEVVSAAFERAPTSWWTVTDIGAGRVGLAILDLSGIPGVGPASGEPMPAGSPTGSALLRLRLRPGQSAGGELSIAGHDFSANDGVSLDTPNAESRLELGALGRVALSAPRPNPFTQTTTFALMLPVGGGVDVGVYNAAGRRVATLLREANAEAGVYALRWDGIDAGGSRATSGMYFVQVRTAAGETSQKLLFQPAATR
jgi:hypothetical protein